jgi:hypothetical protein
MIVVIDMLNLNLRIDEKTYWKFQEIKAKLKAKTNEEALKKLMELVK